MKMKDVTAVWQQQQQWQNQNLAFCWLNYPLEGFTTIICKCAIPIHDPFAEKCVFNSSILGSGVKDIWIAIPIPIRGCWVSSSQSSLPQHNGPPSIALPEIAVRMWWKWKWGKGKCSKAYFNRGMSFVFVFPLIINSFAGAAPSICIPFADFGPFYPCACHRITNLSHFTFTLSDS